MDYLEGFDAGPPITTLMANAWVPSYTVRSLPRRLTEEELARVQARILIRMKTKMKRCGRALAELYLFIGRDKEWYSLTSPIHRLMASGETKDALRMFIRSVTGTMPVYGIIIESEVWMAPNGKPGPIAGRPDAVEAIMVTLETKAQRSMLFAETIRGRSGQIRTFRDHSRLEAENDEMRLEGRLFDFFALDTDAN